MLNTCKLNEKFYFIFQFNKIFRSERVRNARESTLQSGIIILFLTKIGFDYKV
jgi:hypothetical protein